MCLVHIHLSTKEFLPIEVLNRRLGLSPVGHFDKTKTSGLATVLIFNDRCRAYLPEGFKGLSKIFL
jgi:hypothetical protein